MPRKALKPREKRGMPKGDSVYNSVLVARFINKLDHRGKKSLAEKLHQPGAEMYFSKIFLLVSAIIMWKFLNILAFGRNRLIICMLLRIIQCKESKENLTNIMFERMMENGSCKDIEQRSDHHSRCSKK